MPYIEENDSKIINKKFKKTIISNDRNNNKSPINRVQQKKQVISIFLLIVTTILWGSTFIITKIITSLIPVYLYMGIRFLIAGICFFPLYKHFKGIKWHHIKISLFAALLYWFSNLTQTLGLQTTTASKAGFITGLNVIMVPIFLAIFWKKPTNKFIWIGVILATLGTAVLSFLDSTNNGNSSANSSSIAIEGLIDTNSLLIGIGDILIIICAVLYAFYIIYIDKTLEQIDIFAYSSIQMIFVSLYSFILFFCTNFSLYKKETMIENILSIIFNPKIIVAFIYMGVIATAGSLVFQIYGQKHISPTKSAIIFSLEPVFATLFGILIGGEILSISLVIGASLIFIGILISQINPGNKN
ncbi:MAG: DMT family transporter [Promethearchaeota archaeon]